VRDALLAALDDCTEEVRYQAAIALCQVAGNPCKNCDKSGCCNAEVMNKLNEMAYGQDAKGCYKESSSRVRAAATNALNACKRKNPTTSMQPVPETTHETPEEAKPETREMPVEPTTPGPGPTPAPLPPSGDLKYAPPSNRVHLTGYTREGVAEASGSAPGNAISESTPSADGIAEQVAFLRWGDRCRRGYTPQYQVCPEQPQPAAEEQGVKPGETPVAPAPGATPGGEALAESAIPPSNALASNYGATSGPLSSAPNMIGDFFGGAGVSFSADGVFLGTAPMPGNAIPRFKMAENTSPLPMDRVYFDFSSYSNVPLTDTPSSVSAYAAGFEKAFWGGRMSVEVRAPMATTLDNDVYFDGTSTTQTGQFGDLAVALKTLLIRREKFLLSGGLAMTAPTARDSQIFMTQQSAAPALLLENESVHLMPFLGGLWTPNDRWFGIGYVQVDVDASGDFIAGFDPFSTTPTEQAIGRYYDSTVLFADLGLGYWARRSNDRSRCLTGLAYVVEWHLNQSLESQQVLSSGNFDVGTPASNISFTDMTCGLHLELYKMTTVTCAYCFPLTSDGDRQFDSQFRLFLNRRF
jgi:hypothetical protein